MLLITAHAAAAKIAIAGQVRQLEEMRSIRKKSAIVVIERKWRRVRLKKTKGNK